MGAVGVGVGFGAGVGVAFLTELWGLAELVVTVLEPE